MKKLLLVSMLLLGAVTFARDENYQEKTDEKVFEQPVKESSAENKKEIKLEKENMKKDQKFLTELSEEDRGHEAD